jgi:hypothetical protein
LDGAFLSKGLCSFGQEYKTQQIATIGEITCGTYSFSMLSGGSKIALPSIKNSHDQLYD